MKANIPEVEALVNTDRSLVCDGKKGLLTRILTVMKREPPDSSFRSEPQAVSAVGVGIATYLQTIYSTPIHTAVSQFIAKACNIKAVNVRPDCQQMIWFLCGSPLSLNNDPQSG